MHSVFTRHIHQHRDAIECLVALRASIERGGQVLIDCLQQGYKVMLCGYGGSAADAQHIAAELVGRVVTQRRGLPVLALTTDTSILTAVSNDFGFDTVFARQVEAHARPGDVLVAISTSGDSANVLAAVATARDLGCQTIGLLGRDGGRLQARVDTAVTVPAPETATIQECHIVIGHIWCAMVDALFAEARP